MFGGGTCVSGLQGAEAVELVWSCLASFKSDSVLSQSSN